MLSLLDIQEMNAEFEKGLDDLQDTMDSWDPENYADKQDLGAPEWQGGVQPWSRGPAGSNKPITEAEWQARKVATCAQQ